MNVLKMTSQNDLDRYNLNKGHSNKDDCHSSSSEPSCMNSSQRSHSIASFSTITNECIVCLQNEMLTFVYKMLTHFVCKMKVIKNSEKFSIKVGKNKFMTSHKLNNASSDQLNELFRWQI